MAQTRHIDWVDAAKGMSILMVVMLYSVYSVGEDTGAISSLHYVIGFMTPFRMPDFFAISGLFLARTLTHSNTHFFDRRVVHYGYFYLLWVAIHLVLKVALAEGNPGLALTQFAWSLVEPYGVLWFLYVLMLVNLGVWLLHALRVPHWLGLIGAAALEIAPIHTGAYAVDQFATYFVFFYAGYALAPMFFNLVALAQKYKALALSAISAWALMNAIAVFLPSHTMHTTHIDMGIAGVPGLGLVYSLLGIMALFAIAGLLSGLKSMAWLKWIGKHSIVLYVAFALPMTATRMVLLKTGIVTDPTAMGAIVFAAAVAGPFALYAAVQKTGIGKFLFERPAFLYLDRLPARHQKLIPAE